MSGSLAAREFCRQLRLAAMPCPAAETKSLTNSTNKLFNIVSVVLTLLLQRPSFFDKRPLMRSLIGFCLLYLVTACIAVPGQYRFDTWNTDNGLPQNGVREITQTPEGYLWFTTYDGLVRFDGVRFTTFNKSNTKGIINNRFTSIFSDTDGTIYASTMEDGVLTIYRNGEFTSITSDQVPGRYVDHVERGPDGELRFVVDDDDQKTTSSYHLRDGKFEFIDKSLKGVFVVFYTGKFGTDWTVRSDGVTESKNGKSTFIPLDLTAVNFRPNVFEDNEGNLWIGENKIHCIRNGHLRSYGESDGMPGNTIYHSPWQEADGSVWYASGGGSSTGVGLIQFIDGRPHIWGKEDGFANRLIQTVFHDREGTVWLGTDRGLSRRRTEIMHGYSTADGLRHSEIYPLYRDRQDNIWIGSSKGISIFRDGKFAPLVIAPATQNAPGNEKWRDDVMSVQTLWEDPNGKMWVGVGGGIFLVENGKAERLYMGTHVSAISSDRLGNVWAATNDGLLRFTDYKLTAKYTTKDGLPNEFMTFIFEDSKGTLWFGGFGGLTRFEDGHFLNYTKREGLTGNYVRTIHEDSEGTLWIGTYDEGLSRFKDGKFVNYKEKDGLYNSGVFAIEEDAAGYFWISSNHGIYRVKKQDLDDFADAKIDKINSTGYGKEDGMLSNECNGGRQPASIRDKDGKIWFPTQEGVVVVDPMAEQANALPPTVVIEDVLADREPLNFRGGISIEPGQNDLEIRYTGISLLRSEQVKFQYKLEGKDNDWVDAGTRRSAFYSYLPPGKYTFRVRAANSDGVWAEQAAELPITLQPYFYQTRNFYSLVILVLVLGLFVVWKISVRQLEARERRLMRLVSERTAELAEANENLRNLANSDGLTRIGNRRRFESFLADEWHRADRFNTEISLIMIDIDHFKLFNDTYGHQAGDDCLQQVAEAFAETIKRPTDLVARFGGEEFALVLGGTDAEGALLIAIQAMENVKKLQIPHSTSTTNEFLTVSAGIATTFAARGLSEIALLKAADGALYKAKENGRNQIYVHGTLTIEPVEQILIPPDHLHPVRANSTPTV